MHHRPEGLLIIFRFSLSLWKTFEVASFTHLAPEAGYREPPALHGPARSANVETVKRIYILVLGAIVIAGGVYIYLHRQSLGIFRSASSADQFKPAVISWTLVDRSREGFKVEMPEDVREIEVPAYTESGATEPVDMIYAYPDPATSFSISWADQPPVVRASEGQPGKMLEDARNGALARTQSVLVSEAQSDRQGFPVHDFVARNQGGGIFNARLVLADRRLYLLMASFPAAGARRDEDVNRFFDSFHVVSAASLQ
jgi:hypothetical protein